MSARPEDSLEATVKRRERFALPWRGRGTAMISGPLYPEDTLMGSGHPFEPL